MRPIPVRNLYYLLLYAWDKFPEGEQIDVGVDAAPDLPNLLARVLLSGSRKLLRRGLDRGYLSVVEELAAPHGRFLLGDTVKRNTLLNGRIVCAYDELNIDVPHNRILKAAARTLASLERIDATLAVDLAALCQKLTKVTDVPLSRGLFGSLQLTRNTGHYGLMMNVCALVVELTMPEEGGAGSRFAAILEDEVRMSSLFEAFVRNFYRQEQKEFSVAAKRFEWDVLCVDEAHRRYLPTMSTDVMLRSPDRTLVIDAKFYKETLVSNQGGPPRVRPAHLYQLLAYLTNMERLDGADGHADGILIYPSIDGEELQLEYQLERHGVRVWSVDLSRPWRQIHSQMLAALVPRQTFAQPAR